MVLVGVVGARDGARQVPKGSQERTVLFAPEDRLPAALAGQPLVC